MQITTIVLHYKRKENVSLWMKGIRDQTMPSKVIVWDNSGDYPAGSGEDWLIRSSENRFCIPRLALSAFVETPYIYNQDDDLAINDTHLFEKFIEHSKKYPEYVIGWNGRVFYKDINWDKAYQSPGKGWVNALAVDNPQSIDMINFGVSFLPTHLMDQVPSCHYWNKEGVTHEELKYGDDIWVSYWLKKKRVMPFELIKHYDWLNEYKERNAALSKQPKHMDYRNSICRKLFQKRYR